MSARRRATTNGKDTAAMQDHENMKGTDRRFGMQGLSFDVLKTLSLARTAITDPGALGLEDGLDDRAINCAVDRIDEAMGALNFEQGVGKDDYSQAQWVVSNLGRLVGLLRDELLLGSMCDEAVERLDIALDSLDAAWTALEKEPRL